MIRRAIRTKFITAAGVGGLILSTPAMAQQEELAAPLEPLAQCRAIAGDAERLACFDREVAALVGKQVEGEVTVVSRDEIRQTKRSLFGLKLPKIKLFGSGDDDEPELKEIESTVVAGSDIGGGRFRLTIEQDNMTWVTLESALMGAPRPGDKVEIERGAVGSYFLRYRGQKWVRARRID